MRRGEGKKNHAPQILKGTLPAVSPDLFTPLTRPAACGGTNFVHR